MACAEVALVVGGGEVMAVGFLLAPVDKQSVGLLGTRGQAEAPECCLVGLGGVGVAP